MHLRGGIGLTKLDLYIKKKSSFTKVFYLYFENSKSQRVSKSNWNNRRLTFNRSNFSRRVTSGTLGAFRRIDFVTIIADGTDITRSIVLEVSLHIFILKKKREWNKPHHNDNSYLNYWGLSNVIISISKISNNKMVDTTVSEMEHIKKANVPLESNDVTFWRCICVQKRPPFH